MHTFVVKLFALTFFLVVTGCGKEEPSQSSRERPIEWNDPLDPAVATVPEVIERTRPVLLVTRDAGHGGWQFMDGSDTTGRKPVIILKEDMLKLDPSISQVLDLPVGRLEGVSVLTGGGMATSQAIEELTSNFSSSGRAISARRSTRR
jgi:hypothetical protein